MLPDKLLINLRILSKIQKNGRITKSIDGIINLEQMTLYKGIKRFLNNDSRKQSVYEINSIVDETQHIFEHLLNNKYMNKNYSNTTDYLKIIESIRLLLKELNDAKQGIENLKFTYKTDENIVSQIDIIILKINTILKNISHDLEKHGINEINMTSFDEQDDE
jgi:hypothetical protein